MYKTKAVIFDMDGVIIDSEPLWKKAEIEVFGNHGYSFNEEMCERTKGMRVDEVTVYWKEQLNASFDPNQVKNEIVETIIALILKEGKAMKGLNELLICLKEQNYKLAVASSSPMVIINAVLNSLNIRDFFQVIHSAQYEDYGKPHPQVFITAAQHLNIKPHECIVIEDSFYGIIAAIAAKMKVIALPFKTEPNLDKFIIADYIVNSHVEIRENELFK